MLQKMTIVGSKKMIVYDDISDDKIIIYDKGIDKIAKLGENMDFDSQSYVYNHRSGDSLIPKINWIEPLKKEIDHFELPEKNEYAVGVFFLKKNDELRDKILKKIEEVCNKENIPFLGWRICPTYEDELGWSVKPTTPYVYHLFVGKSDNIVEQDDFERKIYVLRQCIDK